MASLPEGSARILSRRFPAFLRGVVVVLGISAGVSEAVASEGLRERVVCFIGLAVFSLDACLTLNNKHFCVKY
jgi:hypothetical protein